MCVERNEGKNNEVPNNSRLWYNFVIILIGCKHPDLH